MKLTALILIGTSMALHSAEPDVLVLDGAETIFMNDALKRIECPFDHAASLDATHRILILCGKNVSADGKAVASFLQSGGHVLAVGGGAKWMIDAKLFDASGYYPTGTTEHYTTFEGYHCVTFGYPMAAPVDKWFVGVPSLLRATNGPLMRLGPKASSVLSAGEPFSLAAFQRIGKGIALLIGADPQGGNEFQTLGKATPKSGDALKTDLLLANAIAWLRDPGCNLIPNPGFEDERTEAVGSDKSHWEIITTNGGASEWRHSAAPEGKVFLVLKTAKPNATASVNTYRPIVVEGGAAYQFTCRYQSSVPWQVAVRYLVNAADERAPVAQTLTVPAAAAWQPYQTDLTIPNGSHLVSLILRVKGGGELSLDDFTITKRE